MARPTPFPTPNPRAGRVRLLRRSAKALRLFKAAVLANVGRDLCCMVRRDGQELAVSATPQHDRARREYPGRACSYGCDLEWLLVHDPVGFGAWVGARLRAGVSGGSHVEVRKWEE